jgi:hypothetical protein
MATALTDPGIRAPDSSRAVSRMRVENVLSRSVAWFGILFGLQAATLIAVQHAFADLVWDVFAVGAIAGALVLSVVCSTLRRFVTGAHLTVAVVYLIALVTWPLFPAVEGQGQQGDHWLYLLTTVATSSAAIGLRLRGALLYLFIVPMLYGVIRTLPNGGGAPIELGFFNALYSILLGGAVLVLMTIVRATASAVDDAQSAALDRYAAAVREQAMEVERVQVDAIVHDSVLTTLLAAARAETPAEHRLAGTMATHAIQQLEGAALPTSESEVDPTLAGVAGRIARAAEQLSEPITIDLQHVGDHSLSAAQAETLFAASIQALVNSLQHAGAAGVRRWLRITSPSSGAVEIEVGDDGRGFVFDDVPAERLGVRRSIIERVANAGGTASVVSSLGRGTVVRLVWPAVEEPS